MVVVLLSLERLLVEGASVEVGFEEMMVEAGEGRAGMRYSCAEERMMLRSCSQRGVD